jgi:hypothetical protein
MDWTGSARKSIMQFDPSGRSKRSLGFRGEQAATGWRLMMAWAQKHKMADKFESGAVTGGKRKRTEDDDDEAPGPSDLQPKKRARFGTLGGFNFFGATSEMQE